eukprot:TRINITY_DN5973_c0_g1_i3.p1 TRINITY_DN5973_c0_g1~~TRINITY_DN5973_c0_g1_i3.p1  ORF type:complete len:329 (+),score=31.16 TRINITY_DN5973_c0_g1_i3:89-1075(+)
MTVLNKKCIAYLCFIVLSLQNTTATLIEDIREFKEMFVSISDSSASVNSYAVHLSHHSNTTVFRFKMRACNGKVLMRAASDQHKLMNEIYDLPILFENYRTDQLLYVQKRQLDTIYLHFILIEGYKLNGQQESVVRIEMKTLQLEDIQNVSFIRYGVIGNNVRKEGSGYFNVEVDAPYDYGTFTPIGFKKGPMYLMAQSNIRMFAANDRVFAEFGLKCGVHATEYADFDVKGFTEEKYKVTEPVRCTKGRKAVCRTQIYVSESTQDFYLALGAKMNYDVIGEVDIMYYVSFVRVKESSGKIGASRKTFLARLLLILTFILIGLSLIHI